MMRAWLRPPVADAVAAIALASALPAFWTRMALYALAWWLISRPLMLARKGRVAIALMAYLVVGTLASTDLVMSLVPGWYSTAFGFVNLGGGALGGSALAIAIV